MYEVEWTSDVPNDECGDAILDAAVTHTRYFKTRAAALRFAAKVLPQDYFGAVAVTECHEEPYEPGSIGTYIEYDSEPEYVEA